MTLDENSESFRKKVIEAVASVPYGMVTTYGDVAAVAGSPYAARVVGSIAHYGDQSIPWHRLVNRFGGLASGFYGGREVQATLLLDEGVTCTSFIVDNFSNIRFKWGKNE